MRVFSGIQPTGEIHIGNYLGAIKNWVELQKKADCIFCIVDLHALTVQYDVSKLQNKIYEKVIAYIAAGINPKKSIIFTQSQVSEHTELNWLLSSVAPVGELQRMTQYKEKAKKHNKNINAGLLTYPVLMAADILLYQTDVVPVGKDQKQHVELARKIARRFNQKFGKTFKLPNAYIPKTGAKIMSLTDPKKKMSKTDRPETYISLFDSPAQIKAKIMSAQTDSEKQIKYSPVSKPGISNLLTIYSLFSGRSIKNLEEEFENRGYVEFKKYLITLLIESLNPFQQAKKIYTKKQIQEILDNGANQAQKIAQVTMDNVRKKMGL